MCSEFVRRRSNSRIQKIEKVFFSLFQVSTMLIIWLLCVFALITQSNSIKNVSKDRAEILNQSVPSEITNIQEDLDRAETRDAQVGIIKQIQRVNDDGSYTVGYEADDGTFKIESRDVLGNVKGTYGYVDENGEIKRVSYSANNGSDRSSTSSIRSSSTTAMPSPEQVVHIPRQNRSTIFSSTSTRPALLANLKASTPSPTRVNVVQAIPKRRILISSSSMTNRQYSSTPTPKHSSTDRATASTRKSNPTTSIVYATSMRTTSTPPMTTTSSKTIQRTTPKLEITDHVSKVHVNQVQSTTAETLSEKNEEKQRERKPVHGNFLRRQLPDENSENFETAEQVVYSQSAGEESNPLYGGVSGNVRQLFTTTASPRIPAAVLAARQRASNLKKITLTSTPSTTSTTERIYSKPPRRKQDRRLISPALEPTTESTSENYLTQTPIPVQIPANREQISELHENRVHRQPMFPLGSREYVRSSTDVSPGPRQFRIPIPTTYSAASSSRSETEQYLRETTDPAIREKASTTAEQEQYAAVEPHGRSYLPYQQPIPTGYESPQQNYPIPSPFYRPIPEPGNGNYGSNLDRPLTARDFERLLNILIFRQQNFQRFNNYYPQPHPPNPYLYPGYNPYANNGFFGYPPHMPRPPFYNPYDPRNAAYNRIPVQNPVYATAIYNEDENIYQAQNPIPEQQVPYVGQQRMVTRKRQYTPQFYDGSTTMAAYPQPAVYPDDAQNQLQAPPIPIAPPQSNYLPPEVREELLYRMLMLAIHSENAAISEASAPPKYVTSSTTGTTTITPTKFKKPVRSVQILGEE